MNRKIKFIVDENLLGLLKKLRMLGVDSVALMGVSDSEIHLKALSQDRIILTKDRRFFARLSPESAYFVTSELPKEQLIEVLKRFPECGQVEPLSRCFICNTVIEKIDKEAIRTRVDAKTFRIYDNFYECPTCHKIYWEGSHFEKLQREIQDIKNKLSS